MNNSLRKNLICIILLCVSFVFVYAQNDDDDVNSASSNLSETELKIEGKTDSDTEQTGSSLNLSTGSVSLVGDLFRVVVALIIICILAYIILKFLKKSRVFNIVQDPYLKVVATLKLDSEKSIHVVTVVNEAFLVGVSPKGFTNLGKLEDTDIIDAMNLASDKNEESPKENFSSVLSSFFPSSKKNHSASQKTSFLSSQRDRLNRSLLDEESAGDNNEKD